MPISREPSICPVCKKPFQRLVVHVLSHEVYRAKVCEDCLPKDEPAGRGAPAEGGDAMIVQPMPTEEALPWLLSRHYARRKCPVSHAFGAYRGAELVGVVTYGTPASAPLRGGICGEAWAVHVLELNRLCCESEPNLASMLVGRSLRLLPRPSVVVSYADTAQGHVGYIYQATNFLYTGLSAKRTDWKIRGREHLHGATVADESRGQENRAEWMRGKYGDDFYLEDRPRKHRYVYACGSPRQRKAIIAALLYPVEPYPKGDSRRYDASAAVASQMTLI